MLSCYQRCGRGELSPFNHASTTAAAILTYYGAMQDEVWFDRFPTTALFGGLLLARRVAANDMDRHLLVAAVSFTRSFPVHPQQTNMKWLMETSLFIHNSHFTHIDCDGIVVDSTCTHATERLVSRRRHMERWAGVPGGTVPEEVGRTAKSPQRPIAIALLVAALDVGTVVDSLHCPAALLWSPWTLARLARVLFARFAPSLTPSRPAHR